MSAEHRTQHYFPLNNSTGQLLRDSGYHMDVLLEEMQAAGNRSFDVLNKWTGLPYDLKDKVLWERERDELVPHIQDVITAKVQPWLDYSEELPTLSVLEIARETGFHPPQLVNLIKYHTVKIITENSTHFAHTSVGWIPQEAGLNQCRRLEINPKRVMRRALERIRESNGNKKLSLRSSISSAIRAETIERGSIYFDQFDDAGYLY